MEKIKRFDSFSDSNVIEENNTDVVKEPIKESLPNQKAVDQWNMVRKLSKGIDIGDRITNMEDEGANIAHDRNVIDSGIESFEDYEEDKHKTHKQQMKYMQKFNVFDVYPPTFEQ